MSPSRSSHGQFGRFALVLVACVATLLAQGLPPGPGGFGAELPAVFETRLEFRFADGTGAEWRDGTIVSRTGVDLSPVTRWLGDAEVGPWITVLSWDELDALHRHACAVLPEHNRPAHLGLWFRAELADAAAADQLLAHLRDEPLVAHAYKTPIPYPATVAGARHAAPLPPIGNDLPPTTPSFTSQQHAHEPTPVGHGVRLVDGVLGARGQGIGLFMIENTFQLDHEDVSKLVAANFLGVLPTPTPPTAYHGLAGASIVMADRNSYGITGIADRVDARFASMDTNGGFGNTIAMAIQNGQPGDVVLVVIMVLVPGLGPGTWLPFEFYQSVFDATLTATAFGLHVVAPAGNGDRSLDDPALLGRFDRSFRDSGAILVGASDGGLPTRAQYSNWGSRIDAHSWGNGVVACGYGTIFFPNSDPLQSYTASGTGTSSATPHIAAVVAAIQGAAQKQLGARLSNQQVLDVLHAYGATTPDVIGRRPDLVEILDVLGVHDGLTMGEPDVPLGGTIEVTLDGPAGGIAALFGAFAEADLPVGLNRNLHLDPLGMSPVGAYLLGTPGPHFTLAVPVDTSLQGSELFFQAARLVSGQPLELSNSGQVTIL